MPYADVNDVRLYYEETGQGFPVVFSHEFAGDYRSWEHQVRYLSRMYRCITYNHRGFPPSSIPDDPQAYSQDLMISDLHALLGHLGIEKAHLVGLSLGANFVLNFALRYPDLCRSIVVAGCGSGSTDRAHFEKRIQNSVQTLLSKGMQSFAEDYTLGETRLTLRRKDPKGWTEFREQLKEHSSLGSALVMQEVILRRATIFSLKDQLNQLRVPTLILVGDEDKPCIEPGLFLRKEISSSGLAFFPRTGHAINLEEPALFNDSLSRFFHLSETGRWSSE